MNVYHIGCNLKGGVRDAEFTDRAARYLGHLREQGLIAGYRITRRQLGLGPPHLPEFHLTVETEDLAQLDKAFSHVASRGEPVESFHHAVNSLVCDTFFALYRDFPDAVRVRGEEKF
ncbi:MAG: hypothetical protein OEU09_03370 [Rhodospirillales bacterium]|nr:hypothetical protein [Rhodospirillales bacterium]MDH3793325.1 hypothetical protein [Rhodospirillales bacterium]MDH3910310.1 hypothetical protein [Rhodospirillales bacterium]MDH3919129.1 hypothetical protein [Rhodospirillales bacterium]MDH3970144.1 hypothetical protein [Rhodospirillales bacterium]